MFAAEHRRPFAAFLLVCAAGFLITAFGLRSQVVQVLVDNGAPAALVGVVAPDVMLGERLNSKPAPPVVAAREVPTETLEVPDAPAASAPSTTTLRPASTDRRSTAPARKHRGSKAAGAHAAPRSATSTASVRTPSHQPAATPTPAPVTPPSAGKPSPPRGEQPAPATPSRPGNPTVIAPTRPDAGPGNGNGNGHGKGHGNGAGRGHGDGHVRGDRGHQGDRGRHSSPPRPGRQESRHEGRHDAAPRHSGSPDRARHDQSRGSRHDAGRGDRGPRHGHQGRSGRH